MRTRLRESVYCAVSFLVGAIAAFATAGPALLADGSGTERMWVLLGSLGLYALLGFAAGAAAPTLWKIAAGCLVIPLLPLAFLFWREALESPQIQVAFVAFSLGCPAVALGCALLGARWRLRRLGGIAP